MLIELGGGTKPHPSADIIIDLHHPKGSDKQDATIVPWLMKGDVPIETACADIVYASHFMEHVLSGQPLLNVLNEAWRVLKPGGRFNMEIPLVGYTDPFSGQGKLVSGWWPFADPTHVSYWWFPERLLYVCEGNFKPHADYGISTWEQLGDWTDDPYAHPRGGYVVMDGWLGRASLVKPS